MANCLVLGANGFLGSHLVDQLAAQGHYVRCFDRFSQATPQFTQGPQAELFHGEFLNEHDLEQAIKDIDYVFHFISTTTPISSDESPLAEVDTNIRYSVELFRLCAEANVKKVIFSSSGGTIYGNTDSDRIDEQTLTQPISPYSIGKLTIENYLRYFYEKFDLNSVSYRISNPYGPRQALLARQGVIPIFLSKAIASQPITVYGDGSMVRDYLYVDDAIAMVASTFDRSSQPVYNIGSGIGTSINDLLSTIHEVTGTDFTIDRQPVPSTFVHRNVLDVSRYNQEFGEYAYTPLVSGIKETWDHYWSQQ